MLREVVSRVVCAQATNSMWDDTRPIPNAVDSELARLVYSRLRFMLLRVRGRLDWSVLHTNHHHHHQVLPPPLVTSSRYHHYYHHCHHYHSVVTTTTIAISSGNTSSVLLNYYRLCYHHYQQTPATWRRRGYSLPLTHGFVDSKRGIRECRDRWGIAPEKILWQRTALALAFGVGVGASDSSGMCHSTPMPGASQLMTIIVRVLVRPLVRLGWFPESQ